MLIRPATNTGHATRAFTASAKGVVVGATTTGASIAGALTNAGKINVSAIALNATTGSAIARGISITSNVTRVYPFEVLLEPSSCGLPRPSKAQAQQIRTIDKRRLLGKPTGSLPQATLDQLEEALRLHLDL